MDKGLVLKHFLEHLRKIYPEWQPANIIFFDNQEDNLQSVEAILKDFDISYTGFLYTFSENLLPINLKLGEFQLHHFLSIKNG